MTPQHDLGEGKKKEKKCEKKGQDPDMLAVWVAADMLLLAADMLY
jgi:hypothetical protein